MWRYFSLSLLLCLAPSFASDSPQRIIALAPHLSELVYSLGAGDRLVATVEHADYPAVVNSLPRVGNYAHINIEAIVALQPDLVLIWPQGSQLGLAERLADYGINSYSDQVKGLNGFAEQIYALGIAIGEPQQAQRLQRHIQQQLAQLRNYQQQAQVSVFYQIADTPLRSISKDSWLQEYLDHCGARNIMADASSPYPTVALEHVLAADPQMILQVQQPSTQLWQRWPALQAVQNHHVIDLDPSPLHRLTLRSLPALVELCSQIDQVRAADSKLKSP